MRLESISSVTASAAAATSKSVSSTKSQTKTSEKASTSADTSSGVIYEKKSSYSNTAYSASGNKTVDNSSLIAQMKADTESRTAQLRSIVTEMMQKQGATIGKADDIWSFLASGDYTVSEAAQKKAQEEISKDGYWGVDQTSDRIVSFAIALSGNDTSKADTLIQAFQKGYKEATKSWGKELPDISKQTYDAVLEKFDKWVNGEDSGEE